MLRIARPCLATAASLLACLVLPATVSASIDSQRPTQGIYENCDPRNHESECLERLAELRDAGITVVLNYWAWQGTPAQELRYADRAQELGMKLIWPTSWAGASDPASHVPELAEACDCNGTDLLDYAVELVRDHPATWGYYVGEELWEPNPALSAAADRVGELDPEHPRLFVGWGASDLAGNLRVLADGADMLGSDYYPVAGWPLQKTRGIARQTHRVARSEGKQAAIVLQAFNWDSEPTLIPPGITGQWPTTRQMRQMRNLAFLGGDFPLMLWFDYYFIKPLGTSDESHLDALAKALRARYPIKVRNLRCQRGRLAWEQSRRGRVAMVVKDAEGKRQARLRRSSGVSLRRLDLRRGEAKLRVSAGSARLRSTSNRLVLRPEGTARARPAC